MKQNILGTWWLASFLAAAFCVSGKAHAAEPSELDALQAAVQAADEQVKAAEQAYNAYYQEWDSLEMARSATREIAVSARRRAEADLEQLLAARQAVAQKTDALKAARQAAEGSDAAAVQQGVAQAAAELEEAQQRLDQKTQTMRQSGTQMAREQRLAHERIEQLKKSEEKLAELLSNVWTARRKALELKAQRAERAAQQAEGAEPAQATEAAGQALAARRAVYEADVVAIWEKQLLIQVLMRDQTTAVAHGHSADAARIAERLVEAETDSQANQFFQEFAAEQRRYEADNQQRLAALDRQIQEAGQGTYPLLAKAMGGLDPLSPDEWDYAKARHLAVRAGFGATPEQIQHLCDMGLYAAVDYLVDYYGHPPAPVPLDPAPARPASPLASKLVHSWTRANASSSQGGMDLGGLRRWWLRRMVESPRPLQEKLVLFWHGHFATQQSVVGNTYTMYQQNQLLREHAAGNFGAMLYGIIHDPAMIRYLDNNSNSKAHPNENLAREIMELFSMGAYQGYTETDVREAARALTGYTLDGSAGQFRFQGAEHDGGAKTIFGHPGHWTGDDLVQLILQQPSTSRFVAGKTFAYFAYDEPNPLLVERLANVLRYHNYELAPMLKNLFLSEEFYSERALGTQIKSPVQLVVGMLRDMGASQAVDYGRVDAVLGEMGQQLFEPPDVRGWRYGRAWISAGRIFSRYNALADLIRTTQAIDLVGFVEQGGCERPEQVIDYLAQSCLLCPMRAETRQQLIEYLGELPARSEWSGQRDELNERLRSVLILMTSMPEYQMT